MTIKAYPLQWPAGWERTEPGSHQSARFSNRSRHWSAKRLTINEGTGRVLEQLANMRIDPDDVVISSNLLLRLDGFPRSGQAEPSDGGVAVYWLTSTGETKCIAIDRYDRVADNLAAVAATLDAMRAIERHGGAEILNRAFSGFTALPPPSGDWRDVLDPADPKGSYRRLCSVHHPDKPGGNADEFRRVQAAWDDYQKERRHGKRNPRTADPR